MKSNKNRKIQILLIIISLILLHIKSQQQTFQNKLDAFRDGSYIFSWSIDTTNKKINMQLDCETKGWVGVGFSPDGTMTNADMILCYMSGTVANCSDRYSKGHGIPAIDTELNPLSKNDLENISGEVKNGRSVFNITRNLYTGDNLDYQIEQGQEINVIFSYRKEGSPETENGIFYKHTKYSGEKVILYPKEGESVLEDDYKKDPNIFKTSLKFENYQIPVNDTTYTCMNFDVTKQVSEVTKNPIGVVYHSIVFEPIIDNLEFLHHIVIFSCDGIIEINSKPYLCDASPNGCSKILFEWAPGSGVYKLPKDVGILWGVSENKNIVVQYHYNNPNRKSGAVDSSSVDVYFTKQLRKYDAATTMIGYPYPLISIPPNKNEFTIGDTCGSPCTKFMKGDINIFSVFLHGHYHLRKIRTEIHYENGTIDNTTMREDNYKFDNQKYFNFKTPIKITNKDKLVTYCTYENNLNTTVKGGDSSQEEMCFNFISYYPRENGLIECFGSLPIIQGCGAYNAFDRNSSDVTLIQISGNFIKNSELFLILSFIAIFLF